MAYKVGIVGATGAVGTELLTLMERRNFPVSELRLLASSRSAGKKVEALGTTHAIEEVKASAFEGWILPFSQQMERFPKSFAL